jgi:hypothetical protein
MLFQFHNLPVKERQIGGRTREYVSQRFNLHSFEYRLFCALDNDGNGDSQLVGGDC